MIGNLSTALAVVLVLVLASLLRHVLQRVMKTQLATSMGCKTPKSFLKLKEPFLGLDFTLQIVKAGKADRYLPFFWELFQKHGYTIVSQRLAYDRVHTIEPENLKHILATEFKSFRYPDIRVNAMKPLLGNGIFTADGPAWAHSRGLLRPVFTRQNMQPLLQMMEKHFQLLLECIPQDGAPFDLQKLFFDFTMDTATDFLLGQSTHVLDPAQSSQAEADFVENYSKCCVESMRKMVLGPLAFVSINRSASQARVRAWAYVERFVQTAIDLRQSGKVNDAPSDGVDEVQYNFLRELARDTDDKDVLRDQIMNILLASRDTTASLLSNLFFELSRRPEVYRRLQMEVEDHFHGELPTEAGLKDMKFLKWCINESLRLHPPVPVNARQAVADTTLPIGGGPDGNQSIFVKKGTNVVYHTYSLHRREDIFGAETEVFRPERWDGLRPGWGFLPWSGGPRLCLGQQFAMQEASYVIARLVQSFSQMEATDNRPWVEHYTLAVCSKNGVHVSVQRA